jgi:two-component system NarL family response regulator
MSIFEELGSARNGHAPPRQLSVLIVDDDAMFGEAVVSLLEGDERITVVGVVESGEAAIDFPQRADVALVDLGLPGIDGIELTRRLLSVSPELRVIVLSGTDDDATTRRALAAGAAAVLVKGGVGDELVDAVVTDS